MREDGDRYSAHYPHDEVKEKKEELEGAFKALKEAILAKNIVSHPAYSS